MKSPKKPSHMVTEEEIMYWWQEFPDLSKEEVTGILEVLATPKKGDPLYHSDNNEAP